MSIIILILTIVAAFAAFFASKEDSKQKNSIEETGELNNSLIREIKTLEDLNTKLTENLNNIVQENKSLTGTYKTILYFVNSYIKLIHPNMSHSSQPILPGIEHIVVVMFENRSFDNMLGGLYPEKTLSGEFNGVLPGMYNRVDPYKPLIGEINVWQAEPGIDAMTMPYPDPGELFTDMNEQIFAPNPAPAKGAGEPTMNGFIYNYRNQPVILGSPVPRQGDVMQYYKPGVDGNIPIMSALAQAYAVSDTWFASGPVQTLVNRIFAHSAQPSTYIQNGETYNCIDNSTITNKFDNPIGSVYVKTIFDLLDEKYGNISKPNWKVYYNDFPLSALIYNVYEHWGPFQPNVCVYDDYFASDVQNDSLPRYSFIEPRYTNMKWDFACSQEAAYQPNSYHPGGACPGSSSNDPDSPPAVSVCFGEQFLADIYSTLAEYPDVFKKTLLIVTFDEHGGLYDHQPPPEAVPPVSGVVNFDYSRYGVRVPAIFINPYISPGTIFKSPAGGNPFDHTSIISTLCSQFDLNGPLTARDQSAPTLEGIINSDQVNSFSPADLPNLSCQVPPSSERGAANADASNPNSIYSIILRGMKLAKLQGKM